MTDPSQLVDDESVERLLAESTVFGGLGADARMLVRKELEPRVVRADDVLIRQGDVADGLYLVGSGRLCVVLEHDDGGAVELNQIGRGDLTGEMALITDRPRSATVVALRDSHVFFLSTDAFTRVVQAHPEAMRAVSGALVDKLMTTIRNGAAPRPGANVVVVPLDRSEESLSFGARLAAGMERLLGPVPFVSEGDSLAALGAGSSALARAMWRDHLEVAHRGVVYQAAPEAGEWTDECVRQADVIVLVAAARGSGEVHGVEELIRRAQGRARKRTELVLLHAAATPWPRGTRRWLDARAVDRHHHVRADQEADVDRVARLLTGRATAVVFSGGGARGIAHIGVVRGLFARGVPIDATAGSSIGAIVAGAVARGDSPDELAAQMRAAVLERSPVDLTFPSIAFAAGGRVTAHIKEGAQGLDVEDTWCNFFCVSTNLTRGALELHTRGPGWAAVRSSFSIPGLFPPMRNASGDVLVDGGLLDNMPVAPMRALHPGIRVIGVDVGARREFMPAGATETGAVSGWKVLTRTLRQRSFDELTTLPRVLLRLTELGSLGSGGDPDFLIRPALDGVSLLDFDKFDRLVELGEQAALAALDASAPGAAG